MHKRGFTLIEILNAISIISVLILLGLFSYSRAVARSRAIGCEVNLKILKKSIDNYADEYDVFPSSLAQLRPKHINRAFAELIIDKEDILTRLGYLLIRITEGNRAYAQSGLRKMGIDIKDLTCPADKTPPPDNISYGINKYLAGIRCEHYKVQKPNLVILADCEHPIFSSIAEIDSQRHIQGTVVRERFGYYITKDGVVTKTFAEEAANSGSQQPITIPEPENEGASAPQTGSSIEIIIRQPIFIPDIYPTPVPVPFVSPQPQNEPGQVEPGPRTGKSTNMGKDKGGGGMNMMK